VTPPPVSKNTQPPSQTKHREASQTKLEGDPGQVLGHRLGGLAKVTQAINFFILKVCKNYIILVNILQKKNQWVLR